MNKVVFLIERTNDLRFFSSIIEKFKIKKINIEIFLIGLSTGEKNFKYYLNPLNIKSKILTNLKVRKFYSKIELHNNLINEQEKISFIFSLTFISKNRFVISSKFLEAINKKWCVVGHGMDSFSQMKDEETYLDYNVNFFFVSNFFLNEGKKYLKRFVRKKNIFDTKKVNIYLVGNAMYSKKIFKKKNHKNKKLIYLPFPYLRERYGNNFAFQAAFSGHLIDYYSFSRKFHSQNIINSFLLSFKHSILNKLEILKNYDKIKQFYLVNNELNLIKSIRKFCNKNNFEFIVKPRIKFPYIKALEKYADKIIFDNESLQFPSLLQKELSTADLIIGSLSSTVYEAAMFNIPYVNIEIPEIAFISKSDKFFYNYKKKSYYNYEGVVFNYKIKEFINNFENEDVSKFNIYQKKYNNYLKKYCGYNNKKEDFGEKIYKLLKLVQK